MLAKIRQFLAKPQRMLWLVMLLAGSSLSSVQALEVTGLYEVELPVASQQESQRKEAARLALERVLQRISGSRAALLQPAVQAALRTPDRYLQEFSYFVATDSPPEAAQRLRLEFDPTLVNRLLREAKQPIWGSNRPNLILWVAEESAARRSVVNAADDSPWQTAILQAGKDTGLPLLLPLMDLQDEGNISVMDVWGLFPDSLEDASRRYRAEAVLGGRVYRSENGQWAGRWLLIFDDQTTSFSSRGAGREQVAGDALAHVAKIMSSRYAIDTSREQAVQLELSVEGIETLNDYARLVSYLEGFTVVRHVAVSRVEESRVTLQLTSESDWDTLKELIALDSLLQPLDEAVVEFEGGAMVVPYVWRP